MLFGLLLLVLKQLNLNFEMLFMEFENPFPLVNEIFKDATDFNFSDLLETSTPHLEEYFSRMSEHLIEGNLTLELINDSIANYVPDPKLVESLNELKIIDIDQDLFSLESAKKIDLFFALTMLFEFMKESAIPALLENEKKPNDKYGPMTKKILAEAIADDPTNLEEDLALADLMQKIGDDSLREVAGLQSVLMRPGRNSYFLGYWLCAELSDILKKYGSLSPVRDLIAILKEIESIYPQMLFNFPKIEYETIKQAARRGRQLEKSQK